MEAVTWQKLVRNSDHRGQAERLAHKIMEAHYLVEAVCEASHGGQGEDWQVRMEAHYLAKACP